MGENLFWLWLSLRCKSGDTFDRLIRAYRSPEEIYRAEEAELTLAVGSRTADVARLGNKDLSDAQRIMRFCAMTDVGILSYGDDRYPSRLRMLPDPPVVLYYKGELPNFEGNLFMTVVGTRRMSEYGKRMTFEIAYDLARAGATVVTGMALGIDGLASASAIAAGGKTVAFLGCGIDMTYPPEHKYLMNSIIRHGAVMTEYPPGTRPEGRNFPHRNRIMSGISQGVLMIEGNRKSGALITARSAEKQGRDLFVLPGNADEENSEGPSLLLKNGATPITCADDIINRYEGVYRGKLNIFKLLEPYGTTADRVIAQFHLSARTYAGDVKRNSSQAPSPPKPKPFQRKRPEPREEATRETPVPSAQPVAPVTPQAAKDPAGLRMVDETTLAVYRKIPLDRAVTVDELCADGTPPGTVMAALTLLEVHKCITMIAGGRYVRM